MRRDTACSVVIFCPCLIASLRRSWVADGGLPDLGQSSGCREEALATTRITAPIGFVLFVPTSKLHTVVSLTQRATGLDGYASLARVPHLRRPLVGGLAVQLPKVFGHRCCLPGVRDGAIDGNGSNVDNLLFETIKHTKCQGSDTRLPDAERYVLRIWGQ